MNSVTPIDAIRTTTTESLLGMLTLRPMSGYDLRQLMESATSNFWSESFGQIYPALKKLADEGLAEVDTQQPNGERLRKVYKLTPAGRARARQWLASPCAQQVPREELLLKLFFGDKAPRGSMRAAVERRKAKVEADLARYAEIAKDIDSKLPTHAGAPYWRMTLNFGIAQANAVLTWCDQTLAELDSIETKHKSGGRHAA